MLDIRLPVGAGGGEKEAVRPSQERREIFVNFGAPPAVLLDMGVGFAVGVNATSLE
jgi:hypothetical protein